MWCFRAFQSVYGHGAPKHSMYFFLHPNITGVYIYKYIHYIHVIYTHYTSIYPYIGNILYSLPPTKKWCGKSSGESTGWTTTTLRWSWTCGGRSRGGFFFFACVDFGEGSWGWNKQLFVGEFKQFDLWIHLIPLSFFLVISTIDIGTIGYFHSLRCFGNLFSFFLVRFIEIYWLSLTFINYWLSINWYRVVCFELCLYGWMYHKIESNGALVMVAPVSFRSNQFAILRKPMEIQNKRKHLILSRQFIATSAEVTPRGSLVRNPTQNGLKSG